jgi:hypothetical protein
MHYPLDNVVQPLYVITPLFNPQRYKRRWKLYTDFQKHVRDAGAVLLTIEASFGERTSAMDKWAQPTNSEAEDVKWLSQGPTPVPVAAKMPPNRLKQDYIKVRVDYEQEIWTKESLLNIATQHLPPDWQYVAWIDADLIFARPDWVSETLHMLQHYHFVQMFSIAVDLSPKYEPIAAHQGFVYSYMHGSELPNDGYYEPKCPKGQIVNKWHPGYAWAARREALDDVGGLVDWAILGAADNHMAKALVGQAHKSVNPAVHTNYMTRLLRWQSRAEDKIKRNIGYVDGTILHYWHGSKHNRYYWDRWKILIENDFDPDNDIYKDARGIYRLTGNKPKLRDQIRQYMRQRAEDSIDMRPEDDKLNFISHGTILPW